MMTRPTDPDSSIRYPNVTIWMPKWMLDELRAKAQQRGVTVTEHIRRAVSLERVLFEDPDSEIVLRDKRTDEQRVVRRL